MLSQVVILDWHRYSHSKAMRYQPCRRCEWVQCPVLTGYSIISIPSLDNLLCISLVKLSLTSCQTRAEVRGEISILYYSILYTSTTSTNTTCCFLLLPPFPASQLQPQHPPLACPGNYNQFLRCLAGHLTRKKVQISWHAIHLLSTSR